MIKLFFAKSWKDYELIDSGDEEKLERFGNYLFVRPEPKAIWHKTLGETTWNNVSAIYKRDTTGGGHWIYKEKLPESWAIQRNSLAFLIKPTGFKHMGLFPEQSELWDFITEKITSSKRPVSVLNLFAYTGASTLAAASAGAAVTHIDSEKEVLTWARENARLSKLDDKPIRWIPEDVITYAKREIKRGKTYDAIIMDPPKYGRGARNEVWKIEEDLPRLMDLCLKLLSPTPLFIIINAYAVSYSSLSLGNLLSTINKKYKGTITSGELVTPHSSNKKLLPNSICGIWES